MGRSSSPGWQLLTFRQTLQGKKKAWLEERRESGGSAYRDAGFFDSFLKKKKKKKKKKKELCLAHAAKGRPDSPSDRQTYRSLVAVGRDAWYSLAPHTLTAVQRRSLVRVGGVVS